MRIEDVIGQWITIGREQTEMTQAELGERLGKLLGKPWSRQAVSAAEKGRRAFTAAELVAFAIVLGSNVEDLLEPPATTDEVTLAEGPPIPTDYLRTTSTTNTDLNALVTKMQELRDEWVTLRGSTQRADLLFFRAYRELVSALRGRGVLMPHVGEGDEQ